MKIGNNDISKIYLGSTEVTSVYLGNAQVYGGGKSMQWVSFQEGDDGTSCEIGAFRFDAGTVDMSWFDDRYVSFYLTDGINQPEEFRFTLTSNGEYELYNVTQDRTEPLFPDGNDIIEYRFDTPLFEGMTVYCLTGVIPFDIQLYAYDSCVLPYEEQYFTIRNHSSMDGNIYFVDTVDYFEYNKEIANGVFDPYAWYDMNGVNDGQTYVTGTGRVYPFITLHGGQSVRFRGNQNTTKTPTQADGIGAITFSGSTDWIAYGNVMSLLFGDNFAGRRDLTNYPYAFVGLFYQNAYITDVSNLILPATTLSERCYRSMFRGCTAITRAPELPAPTLQLYGNGGSYAMMFNGCTSLNYIKCLATTNTTNTSSSSPTYTWVSQVPAGGTFVKAEGVNWSTGTSGIPSGWSVYNDGDTMEGGEEGGWAD